jgi:hypothetical protein
VFIQVWRSSLNTNKGTHTRRKNKTESSYRKPNLCPSDPKRRIRTKSFHTPTSVHKKKKKPREKKRASDFQREKDLIKKQ